ncbi:retrovirus-related pol polyprotein from transposon TNT 1-94 [Tanacetum coccineum]
MLRVQGLIQLGHKAEWLKTLTRYDVVVALAVQVSSGLGTSISIYFLIIEKEELKTKLEKWENSSKGLNKLLDSQLNANDKAGIGYDGAKESKVSETITSVSKVETSNSKTSNDKVEMPKIKTVRMSEPIIEEWESDSEDDEIVFKPKEVTKTVKPGFEKIEFVNARNETVRQAENLRKNNKSPRGNKRNWIGMMTQKLGENFEFNNKACYVCGSFDHLHYTCKHKRKINDQKQVKPVWNNSKRVNHQNFGRFSHPNLKSNIVPQAVLTKSGLVSLNTAKSVSTAQSRKTMNDAMPTRYSYYKAYSSVKRPFNKKITNYDRYFNKRVNTVKSTRVNTARPKAEVNTVKASTSWVWKPKHEELDHVLKSNSASKTLTRYDYVDALGRYGRKEHFILPRGRISAAGYENGVAKRRNRTLIEAIRTMLVDSKLPTTFWAEAVNTACYVLNRVLVIKPHNKTPYELIRGRTPLIDFMKPFGCPVTILNTRDHLGKFDGKADEGFFVGYSVVSKAMRVFNKRTRIVEETLNIRFLENTPNVTGNGPDWLFDVDSLTISMNYVPVVAGNQTNGIAGTRDNIVTGQAEKKTEPEQEYILIPFCTTDPLISQGPKDSEEDSGMKPTEVDVSGASDKDGEDDQATRSEFERLLQQEKQTVHPNSTNSINTVSTPVSAAGPSFTNDDPSSPVNAAEASNAFEDHLFE